MSWWKRLRRSIYYASVIDSNKGNQRTLFNCIDALLNKKCELHYPSSTTDDNSGSIVHQLQFLMSFFSLWIVIFSTRHDRWTRYRYLSSLENWNAVHSTLFHLLFWKNCLPILLPVITNIVNSSLTSATVPDSLKTALLVPLLKK